MTQTATTFDFEALGPATLDWTRSYRLTSHAIGQDYRIEVAYPPARIAPGRKLPVVYVLDGNHAFAQTAQIARALQSGPFPLPLTLVVGVGYHFEMPQDHARWGLLRVRDFTDGPDGLAQARQRGPQLRFGGAAAFLAFIEDELKPFIASEHPVDTEDASLVGASLGGLFALWTLFTRPAAFRRYVAISPAIYWGQRRLLDLEAEQAARASDLPAHVFLGAGSLEEAHDTEQRFVSNVYELEAGLRRRRYPNLDLSMRIFEGETHMSVFPGAVARGLGAVFGGYRDMSDWSRWLAMAEV